MRSSLDSHSPSPIVSLAVVLALAAVPAPAQDCPELVGRWPYGPSFAVAVSGDFAYFGSGTMMMVADVSDSSAPAVVGGVALPDLPQFITVDGGYAYVADWSAGLRVINVSTPSAPVEVGFCDVFGALGGGD